MALTDKLTNIANRIRNYTKKAEKMKLDEMLLEIDLVYLTANAEGFEEGSKTGYEFGKADGIAEGIQENYMHFWNTYTNNNTRTYYRYGFGEQGWTDETFNPPYTIVPTECRYMFQNSGITHLDETQVDFSKCNTLRETFYSADNLETLSLKIKRDTWYNANSFGDCIALKNLTIIGTIGGEGFDVSDCTSLSIDSIKSVLDACNKPNANITVTLPSSCTVKDAEGNEFELETESAINNRPEVKAALEAAVSNKYTISFV